MPASPNTAAPANFIKALALLASLMAGFCASPGFASTASFPQQEDLSKPVDVLLLVEETKGMAQSVPPARISNALAQFATGLGAGDRVAIFAYDLDVRRKLQLLATRPYSMNSFLLNVLSPLRFRGEGADPANALDGALALFRGQPVESRRRAIVILSRQGVNTGDSVRDKQSRQRLLHGLSDEARKLGARIHGLLVGGSDSVDLMSELSRTHGTVHRQADTPDQVKRMLSAIRDEIRSRPAASGDESEPQPAATAQPVVESPESADSTEPSVPELSVPEPSVSGPGGKGSIVDAPAMEKAQADGQSESPEPVDSGSSIPPAADQQVATRPEGDAQAVPPEEGVGSTDAMEAKTVLENADATEQAEETRVESNTEPNIGAERGEPEAGPEGDSVDDKATKQAVQGTMKVARAQPEADDSQLWLWLISGLLGGMAAFGTYWFTSRRYLGKQQAVATTSAPTPVPEAALERAMPPPAVAPERAMPPPAVAQESEMPPPAAPMTPAPPEAQEEALELAEEAPGSDARLVDLAGVTGFPEYPLNQNMPVIIGRKPATDNEQAGSLIIKKGSVSREHARIDFRRDLYAFCIRDLGSLNGTYVNNRR
ncbi:MAG: FHA domain-containing protein, partial [Gammaproteobacteria bacterium]